MLGNPKNDGYQVKESLSGTMVLLVMVEHRSSNYQITGSLWELPMSTNMCWLCVGCVLVVRCCCVGCVLCLVVCWLCVGCVLLLCVVDVLLLLCVVVVLLLLCFVVVVCCCVFVCR